MPVLAGSDKHLEAPAASGEAVGLSALCQPRALSPEPCTATPMVCGVVGLGCSQGWGFGRKLTALSGFA